MTRRSFPSLPRPSRPRGWLLLAPAVLVLAGLTLWPVGRLVVSSLQQRSLTVPGDDAFVGVDVLVSVLSSGLWWRAVAWSVLLMALAVALQLLLAGLVAATVRRVSVPAWITVPLLVTPFALLPVAGATVWSDAVTAGFGPAWFGYDGTSPRADAVAIVAHEVWRGTGVTALILLAGLRRLPPAEHEAALVAGASAWQRLRSVTWPAVAPAVAVAVLWRSLDALRMFEAPLVAADGPGDGPATAPLLVWGTAVRDYELGLAAATALVLLALAAVLGAVLALATRRRPAW